MLKMIVAAAQNRVIGCSGEIPWHCRDDQRRFQALTMGGVVIMGRRTYESLPGALKERYNIVITRNPDWEWKSEATNIEAYHSLPQAIQDYPDAWIIGGEEIYRAALSATRYLYYTEIPGTPSGEVKFPKLVKEDWAVVADQKFDDHTFKIYKRIQHVVR